MHELAIAESVVRSVIERTGERQVSIVRLRVGNLAGVVAGALSFSFDLATAGTPLAGAALEIVEETGRAHCRSCASDFEIEDGILLCHCGSADVILLSGRDLSVTSVDVA